MPEWNIAGGVLLKITVSMTMLGATHPSREPSIVEYNTRQLKRGGQKNTYVWINYLIIFFLLFVSNPSVATVSPAIEHHHSLPLQALLSSPVEVVLIDTAVPDYKYLLDNLGDNAQAFLVDHTKPGLPQLKEILSQFDNISTLHIVSHGFAGGIQIGNANFDTEFLTQKEEEFAFLSRYIEHNGEVFIYGCDVAKSDEGKVFVDTLSLFLGVDVAASDNLTGAAEKGGDWQFEYSTSNVDSKSFLLSGTELGYRHVMPVFAFETATQPTFKSVQETVSSVTMTITDPHADMFVAAGGGYGGTTGNVAGIGNLDTTQHTFIFDVAIDITSMRLVDQGIASNNDVTLTPNVGTPIDVVLATTSIVINPVDWSGVTSIIVTEQPAIDPVDDYLTDIVYDDIVFSIPVSNSAPIAGTVTANNVTQANAGDTSYTFTVDYSDVDSNFDSTTIDVADVTVSGGATIAGASWSGTAASGTATYTVTPPGGTWDDGDNATYTIAIVGSQVGDTAPAYVAANASAGSFTVSMDTTAPIISAVSIPDVAMKVGDVVSATLTVADDGGDIYTNLSGTIGGFALSGLSRTNNTAYAAQFTVTSGGTDVAAGSVIPVSITLDDSAANSSVSYTTAITQASDSIDANNPGPATGSLAVDEGASNGTAVGTVTASDANSYSLTDDAGGRFAIDLGTGVVTVANGSLLVYLEIGRASCRERVLRLV